jgi:sucrose phosphorylase
MFNFLASHDGIGLNSVRGILDPAEIGVLVETTLAHGGRVSEESNPDGSTRPYELNINDYDALNGNSDIATAIDRHVAAHSILFAMGR